MKTSFLINIFIKQFEVSSSDKTICHQGYSVFKRTVFNSIISLELIMLLSDKR